MTTLTIDVLGTPAPQGSKRGFYNQKLNRVQMVESSNKVKPWRQDVKTAATAAIGHNGTWEPLEGAVTIAVTFYLVRPAGHRGTGRNAGTIRASAPAYPATKPDLDKVLRSTFDALGEAGVWRDDSQVVGVYALKHYADDRPPGALITVRGEATAVIPAQADVQAVLLP